MAEIEEQLPESNLPVDQGANPAEETSPEVESTNDDTLAHNEKLESGIEEHDDDQDASDEEEEHDDHEHDDKPEEMDFSDASPQELVTFLDGVLKENKILLWTANVNRAKERYNELFEARRKAALEEFLSVEGNVEMDFRYPLQMADRNWRELFRNYSIKKKAVREGIVKERENNLKKKLHIIEQLKELNEKATESDSFNKLKALQEEWRNVGMVPAADSDNLYKNYRHLVDRFFDQRSLIKEFLDYDRKLNLEAKLEVIEGIRELASKENLAEMMAGVKKLQENWKDIGPVPKENLDELMNSYREVNELITAKKEGFLEELDGKRQQNLKIKEALIEKILELTDDEVEKPWVKKNKELAALIEAWKQVGAVPREHAERIRSEFRDAVKVFNKLKNTFFKEQKREKLANLDLKVEACEKVEKIIEAGGELHTKRNEVIKIQKYWKTIGPTPRQNSDEVWKRFRAACDRFFNLLKEADSQKNVEQVENLKKKEELCAQLEAMAESGGGLEEIKPLEDQFRSIGFVPFSDKQAIEKRFNNAVRAALSQSVKLDDVEPELEGYKKTLEDLLRNTNAGNLLERERMNLRKKMQKQEEELQTLETNIMFFSNSKNADKLVAEIQDKIEKIREDVTLSKKKDRLIQKSFEFTRS